MMNGGRFGWLEHMIEGEGLIGSKLLLWAWFKGGFFKEITIYSLGFLEINRLIYKNHNPFGWIREIMVVFSSLPYIHDLWSLYTRMKNRNHHSQVCESGALKNCHERCHLLSRWSNDMRKNMEISQTTMKLWRSHSIHTPRSSIYNDVGFLWPSDQEFDKQERFNANIKDVLLQINSSTVNYSSLYVAYYRFWRAPSDVKKDFLPLRRILKVLF